MKMQLAAERRLIMTLAMQQSLEILEMPQLDLAARLLAEIERNPLLEYTLPKSIPLPPDLPAPISLYDHLLAQIRERFSPADQQIAVQQLDHLDERGFLDPPLPHEPILSIMRTFDPPGICAKNLQQALLIQLEPGTPAYHIIRDHFEDLLKGRLTLIKKKIKGPLPLKQLARLNFRPAAPFRTSPAATLIPDLEFSKIDGGWIISLQEQHLPQITLLSYEAATPEEKETLRSFEASAKWLFRSLTKRKKLLQEIGAHLVRKQARYLEQKGPLHPITIKETAEELQIHESTLFRALSGKYAATPRGLLSLRHFFAQNIEAKDALARLIAQEDKKEPLTDDELALRLYDLGFSIARRTVAKYRRLLKIGSAIQRRVSS